MLVYIPKNSFNHTTQLWHKYKKKTTIRRLPSGELAGA